MHSHEPHPSYLELDRAALGAGTLLTQTHLRVCAHCSDYVSRIQRPIPVPTWLGQVDAPILDRFRARLGWPMLGFVGAVFASLLVFIAFQADLETGPLIARKGSPTVALYLKRGDDVSRWDGSRPIAPGDQLRLKVVPDGFSNVTVAVVSGGEPEVLYRAQIQPIGETLLPVSWRVDDRGDREELAVVLTRAPVPEGQLRTIVRDGPREKEVWTVVLVLPKREGPR